MIIAVRIRVKNWLVNLSHPQSKKKGESSSALTGGKLGMRQATKTEKPQSFPLKGHWHEKSVSKKHMGRYLRTSICAATSFKNYQVVPLKATKAAIVELYR
jgi:hypothetical protein